MMSSEGLSADIDNGRPSSIPSMYGPKGVNRQRLSHDPDLVEFCQHQGIALRYVMELAGLNHMLIPAADVMRLSRARVEIQVDESERMEVRRES